MTRGETTAKERQRIAEKLLKMPYKEMVKELERLHSDLTINEWSDMYSRLGEYGRKNKLGINYPISKRNPGGWGEMKEDNTNDKLDHEVVNDKNIDAIKDNFTPPGAKDEEEGVNEIVNDKNIDTNEFDDDELYDQMESMGDMPSDMQLHKALKKADTNDNGKIEEDEMADFQKSLDDYASKNKKGRDDIPVTTRR